MSDQKLTAEIRTEFGKGAARRARRAEQIPAVIYGHGAEPIHVLLPERITTRALRTANALLTIQVNGEDHLALAKDVQRDPIRQIIEHIDLLTVRQGEKVTVDISVVVHGEAAPGVTVNQEEMSVSVEAEATHLPERVEINIDGLTAGQHVHAKDIALPANVTLLTDPELLIVHIATPAGAEAAEGAPEAEAPAEA